MDKSIVRCNLISRAIGCWRQLREREGKKSNNRVIIGKVNWIREDTRRFLSSNSKWLMAILCPVTERIAKSRTTLTCSSVFKLILGCKLTASQFTITLLHRCCCCCCIYSNIKCFICCCCRCSSNYYITILFFYAYCCSKFNLTRSTSTTKTERSASAAVIVRWKLPFHHLNLSLDQVAPICIL